jgi:hypothetical protein
MATWGTGMCDRFVSEIATGHNGRERNSLSGEQLPPAEVTPRVNPAHNGEPLTVCLVQGRGNRRRGMPWEALCLIGGMAP